MDAKIKQKWVRALRSGRYEQTTGEMQDDYYGANCCLGVLCRVARAKKVPTEGFKLGAEFLSDPSELTPEGRARFELTDEQESRLIKMNDDENCDFNSIADYIEANL